MDGVTSELKKGLRAALRLRRERAQAQAAPAAQTLRDRFLAEVSLPETGIVAGYWAQGGEIDPAPLMAALAAKGYKLALPCVAEAKAPLIFRSFQAEDPLLPGAWSIPEPPPTAPIVFPDILLVPLLGFDKRGHRLGQGAGYYDRTLTALRAQKPVLAIGLGFAIQQEPEIPVADHDAPLDLIVTEAGVIDPAVSNSF